MTIYDGARTEEKVYIAGPFFTEEELALIEIIEKRLTHFGVEFFSPRSMGILKDMDEETREASLDMIYLANVEAMDECNSMLAVIDNHDPGTMFEMGYFARLKRATPESDRTLVSFTGQEYGMNVMLRQSVDAHLRGLDHLGPCMLDAINGQLKGEQFMAERGIGW